jgi:hypothetical protein
VKRRSFYERNVMPRQESAHADWLAEARAYALRLGHDGRHLTVDDVRRHVPPPVNVDPRVMGAIFRTKDWEPLGFVLSARKLCHHRPVRVFRRRDVAPREWEF